MLHGGEVDVARRLAARAPDLQPREAAVDGLVDRRRRVDRLAVAHIRSFQLSQSSLSACWIRVSPLARISADCAARMLVIARALPSSLLQSLAVASGEGRGVMFRRHPDIQDSGNGPAARRRLLERGPAPVLFVTAGPLLAGVVEQPLRRRPSRPRPAIEPDGIGLLDLDGPAAAGAGHPQNMLGNFGQPQRPDRRRPAASGWRRRAGRLRTDSQYSGGIGVARTRRSASYGLPADRSGQLFHLLRGRHAPACGSVGHFTN